MKHLLQKAKLLVSTVAGCGGIRGVPHKAHSIQGHLQWLRASTKSQIYRFNFPVLAATSDSETSGSPFRFHLLTILSSGRQKTPSDHQTATLVLVEGLVSTGGLQRHFAHLMSGHRWGRFSPAYPRLWAAGLVGAALTVRSGRGCCMMSPLSHFEAASVHMLDHGFLFVACKKIT